MTFTRQPPTFRSTAIRSCRWLLPVAAIIGMVLNTALLSSLMSSQKIFVTDAPSWTASWRETNPSKSNLWHTMSPSRQKEALDEVMPYMKAHANIIKNPPSYKNVHGTCTIRDFGIGWGGKQLCDFPSTAEGDPPCAFISFGIENDYSFDTDLATKKNCRGFSADPSVVHLSQLNTSLVTFHNIGANLLHKNTQQKKSDTEWWTTSVPTLKKFLKLSKINVLKMDCEGCEYALARDILQEEPDFFDHVDQFSFEVHLTKVWIQDTESLYYFAFLFKLLHDAGLKLQHSVMGSCSGRDEKAGCMR
mmetsp:Transcript_20278/g.28894  ORF Transcript_20278/g.28894 Transcript_20278/m.28894 type:complete len:304 (+) Transcript_20278:99-1010(+)